MATRQQAIDDNLQNYCMETDSHEFTERNRNAVEWFVGRLPSKDVVDLGCGDGAAFSAFKDAGVNYLGIDINPHKLLKHPGETTKADMYEWLKEQPDNSIESVFSHHAIEHLANPEEVLDEIARALKPGRLCFITVPYGGEIGGGHYSVFTNIQQLIPQGFSVVDSELWETGYPEIKVISCKS